MSSDEDLEEECGVFVPAASRHDAALGLQLVTETGESTRVDRLLNGGTFGQVYVGTMGCSAGGDGQKVAVKLERQDSPFRQLLHEGNMYRRLKGGPGIPVMHWFGIHPSGYNWLLLQLLGPTVYDLFAQCDHRLSLKTVLLLADQLFNIIEFVHDCKLVHRDISPNNLMMGLGAESHKLFLADFGLAKQYRMGPFFMPAGKRHFLVKRPLVGTIRYASIHTHKGDKEVARRDDLESLAYIFIYLLSGKLPWQGIRSNDPSEKADKIAAIKMNTPLAVLCEDLPEEFLWYLEYTRRLKVYEVPDYTAVRTLLRDLAASRDYQYDYVYDWTDHNGHAPEKFRTDSGDSGIGISVSSEPLED